MSKLPIKIELNFLETLGILAFLSVGVGVFLLVRGIESRNPAAYVILGGLVVLVIGAISWAGVMATLWILNKFERSRSDIEQERFIINAKENLGMLSAAQRVQNQQNAMLLKQARALPSPDEVVDVDALVYGDEVFSELES